MRVLIIVNNLSMGGPQKSLLAMLEQFERVGWRVQVAALAGGSLEQLIGSKATLCDPGPDARILSLPRAIGTFLPLLLKMLSLGRVGTVGSLLASLWDFFRRGGSMNPVRQRLWERNRHRLPEFVGEWDLAISLSGGLASYFMVDCVRATEKWHFVVGDYSRTAIDSRIDAAYFGRVTRFVAVSRTCGLIFQELFPEQVRSFDVLPSPIPFGFYESITEGVPGELTRHDHGEIRIVTVSRIDPDKGLDLAVDACAELVGRGLNVRWLLLGDGRYRSGLERSIAEKGISDKFEVLGFRLNTLDYVKSSHMLVHPSSSEGRSIAVDEALSVGTFVIATKYRTVRDQIENNEQGYLVESSGTAIADAVQDVYENRPGRLKSANPSFVNPDVVEFIEARVQV